MGNGFQYDYFSSRANIEDILLISHSLCLAHISPTGTCEERAQPLVTSQPLATGTCEEHARHAQPFVTSQRLATLVTSQPLATGTREERTQPLVTSQLLARGTCEEHDQPLFSMISQIYKNAEGEELCFLPRREQVGMFLQFRISCRYALSYCSSWYQEIVKKEVALSVKRREQIHILNRVIRGLGCKCDVCQLEWLRSGWKCPAMNFTPRFLEHMCPSSAPVRTD